MGIKKSSKEIAVYLSFMLALKKLSIEKCEASGYDLAIKADGPMDKLLGEKRSEKTQLKIILRGRAWFAGFEKGLMEYMPYEPQDLLNKTMKEA